ncbi:cell wall-binding repeat-containing protein [Metaclostridioides mangenotii]|uniref:Cell wall-binding protein n=1 Tax=Metaclostridioides mangenotii TaxID=1540 RepID=A0ABS4E7P6_9FIRM|nr:cell wall-binding repeat-containing protein [Clostridioides mangenotii]MBP1853959.1 putative cell wall-binding protein [Clostridioides mangenotii]
MNITKKILSLTLSASITLGLTLNIAAYRPPSLDKIQGVTTYETAALIADRQSYNTAILVNLDNSIADGLSASGLSGATTSPILLTKKDVVPDVTMSRLNKVKTVYIIGGVNSVSAKVENALKSKGISITRISGSDRIQTSINVANEVKKYSNSDIVFLTNAFKGEADSISIAAIAAREKCVVILTDGKKTSYNIKNKTNYMVGGKVSMSESFESQGEYLTRLGGADRFETNYLIISAFYLEGNGYDENYETNEFFVADGYNLVNALVGSSIAKYVPIAIVSDQSDKSMFLGSNKITAIGSLSDKTIKGCLDPVPIIGRYMGSWKSSSGKTILIEEEHIYIGNSPDPVENPDYNFDIVKVDDKNKQLYIKIYFSGYADVYRIGIEDDKLKFEEPNSIGNYDKVELFNDVNLY